jgi:YidC/Oxa1 family membrane protein insertase
MDRKSLPLIILCVVLLILWGPLWDWLIPTKPAPRPSGVSTNQVHTASTNAPEAASPAIVEKGIFVPPPIKASAATEIKTLQNDFVELKLSSAGGGIDSILLKKYREGEKGNTILNSPSPIPTLDTTIGDISFSAPYQVTQENDSLRAIYRSPKGLEIIKEYKLGQDYLIAATVTLNNHGQESLNRQIFEVNVGTASPMDEKDIGVGLAYLTREKSFHQDLAGLQKEIEKQKKPFLKNDSILWAAVKNQYFTVLVTPNAPFGGVEAELYPLPISKDHPKPKIHYGIVTSVQAPVDLAPGSSTNFQFSVYAGPNEYKRLAALGRDQDEVLNLGRYIGPFSKILIWLMGHFHSFFHNWGLAIVGVTVLIKIIFWPLTAMSTKSMKQMQALSPKMNALKEKYKDNPQKVNEEMIKMYREYKINPMMGCLPMLVQIPIFFAFYSLLSTSIELRGANFLWIHDLSIPDTIARIPGTNWPINLMPLIMACTMIWQTKITPQAPNADPTMKMMMWLMPAMFLFFCYNFSSGLSLYWTVQNLLTVLQTYMTKDKPVEPPQKIKRKGGFTFSRPTDAKK